MVAAVNGYAIGGGQVLHVLCDLSIASDTAIFGQVGPRVGSFDAGWGTAYLSRLVGERKAREIWFLCRQYSADDALAMGLVNKVVPSADLMAEAKVWASEMAQLSPTALKFCKYSFNADTEHHAGIDEDVRRRPRASTSRRPRPTSSSPRSPRRPRAPRTTEGDQP